MTDLDDQFFEAVFRRQDQLRRCGVECPRCHSHQIQIMDKDPPAKWRCRLCWKKFVFEPPEDTHVVPVVSGGGGT